MKYNGTISILKVYTLIVNFDKTEFTLANNLLDNYSPVQIVYRLPTFNLYIKKRRKETQIKEKKINKRKKKNAEFVESAKIYVLIGYINYIFLSTNNKNPIPLKRGSI